MKNCYLIGLITFTLQSNQLLQKPPLMPPQEIERSIASWKTDFTWHLCGLLAYFKQQNPHGVILAIDIGRPNYLGDEDCLLQQDAQTVMPELAKSL